MPRRSASTTQPQQPARQQPKATTANRLTDIETALSTVTHHLTATTANRMTEIETALSTVTHQLTTMASLLSAQAEAVANAREDLALSTRARAQERPTPARTVMSQDTYTAMGDAIRGQHSPSWPLAEGLSVPRHLDGRYVVFSIPHLLFTYDQRAQGLVKVGRGTLLDKYHRLRTQSKIDFPNHAPINFHTAQPSNSNNHNRGGLSTTDHLRFAAENAEAIRLTLRRAENAFEAHLKTLDMMPDDTHPEFISRDEWIVFIEAGVTCLEAYASLAHGQARGGAKVAASFATQIGRGRVDMAELWPPSFR